MPQLPLPRPRIPLPGPDELSPAQRKVYDEVVKGPRGVLRGPLRAVLHRAELADKWQQLGELLRYRTSLPPRLSELAILVTARHWDSQFEWYQHAPIARKAGLPDAVIAAIANGQRPALAAADEIAVYGYAHELLARHVVDDACYASALSHLKETGIVELTALVGYYTMVAMMLNSQGIPLPEGLPSPLPEIAR